MQADLLGRLRPCFARVEPFLQARKYVRAVMSELPKRNGWTIAEHVRDRTPDRTQRLLSRASWDERAAMAQVRRFAMTGLTEAARKGGRRRGHLVTGAIDETGQEKAGEATAGVKRQYMGCAGRVANGINTVHLSYVREKTGHALIGARQWIPREHIDDPVRSLKTGLPLDLAFRTKGQLAIDICKDAAGDGVTFDFACADEVYGNCTELREFFEASGQAYVLRVPSNFTLTLASGVTATCAEAVSGLLTGKRAKDKRLWEVRSAGKGSKGDRWYAWAWLGTASPRHHLLIRRHLKTGDLAFHYCYVPEGQLDPAGLFGGTPRRFRSSGAPVVHDLLCGRLALRVAPCLAAEWCGHVDAAAALARCSRAHGEDGAFVVPAGEPGDADPR
jgi:SRSO17 transposase